MKVSPQPSQEEAIAIAVALEHALRPVASAPQQPSDRVNWRFSGRWWARSSVARRQRPWT